MVRPSTLLCLQISTSGYQLCRPPVTFYLTLSGCKQLYCGGGSPRCLQGLFDTTQICAASYLAQYLVYFSTLGYYALLAIC